MESPSYAKASEGILLRGATLGKSCEAHKREAGWWAGQDKTGHWVLTIPMRNTTEKRTPKETGKRVRKSAAGDATGPHDPTLGKRSRKR